MALPNPNTPAGVDPNTLWDATPTRQVYNTQTGVTTTWAAQTTAPNAPSVGNIQSSSGAWRVTVPTPTTPSQPLGWQPMPTNAPPLTWQPLADKVNAATNWQKTPTWPHAANAWGGTTTFTDSHGQTQTGSVVKNANGGYDVTDQNGNTRTANPQNQREIDMLEYAAQNTATAKRWALIADNLSTATNAQSTAQQNVTDEQQKIRDLNAKNATGTNALSTDAEKATASEWAKDINNITDQAALTAQQRTANFEAGKSAMKLNQNITEAQNTVDTLNKKVGFSGAQGSNASSGFDKTLSELTDHLSALHDYQGALNTQNTLQNKADALQTSYEIGKITDNLMKNVSAEILKQTDGLQNLNFNSPEGVEKADKDALTAIQISLDNEKNNNLPALTALLQNTQTNYQNAVKFTQLDPNMTNQMNDGYVYNSNGDKLTDNNGVPLQKNIPWDIIGQPQQWPDGNMYAMVRNPVTGVVSSTKISGSNKNATVTEAQKGDYATAIANGQKVDLSALSLNDQMDVQTRAVQINNKITTQPLTDDVVKWLSTAIAQGDPNATEMLKRLSPDQYNQVMKDYATSTHSPTISTYQDALKTNPDGTQSVVRQGYDKFGNAAWPQIQIPKKVLGTYTDATDSNGKMGTMVQYDDGTSQFIPKMQALVHFTVKNADGTTSEGIHDPNSGTTTMIPWSGGTSGNNAPLISNPQAIIDYSTKSRGTPNLQCGQLVNDYWQQATGSKAGLGDTYDSKQSAIQAIGKSNVPVVGGLFVMDTNTKAGHTGIVQSVNSDGSINVLEANRENSANGAPPKIGTYSKDSVKYMDFSVAPPTSDLTPDQQNIVNGLKKYTADPAILSRLAWPDKMKILGAAFGDPNYDMGDYKQKQSYLTRWNSGQTDTNKLSLGTAIGHLDSLYQKVDSLENGNFTPTNAIGNTVGNYFGTKDSKARKTFETNKDAVMTEVAKALKGGNASADQQEINNWESKISMSDTPDQMKGVIKELITNTLRERLDQNSSDFQTQIGMTPMEYGDKVIKDAYAIVDKYNGSAPASDWNTAPSSSWSTATGTINNNMSAEDLAKSFAPKTQ